MKKVAFILAVCILVNLFGTPAHCYDVDGQWDKGGNWTDEEQGMRFSVYDYVDHYTVSTFDTFSNMAFDYGYGGPYDISFLKKCNDPIKTPYCCLMLRSSIENKPLLYASGCKLDYLYRCETEFENDFGALAQDVISGLSSLPLSANYCVRSPGVIPVDSKIFEPIIANRYGKNSSDIEFYTNESISRELRSENAAVLETILQLLGFYVNEDMLEIEPDLQCFESDRYVLVIEPVFWVGYPYYRTSNYFGTNDEQNYYFYGTSTEWAMYAETMKNLTVINKKAVHHNNHNTYNGEQYGCIECHFKYNTMLKTRCGAYCYHIPLLCVALPLSCTNHNISDKNLGGIILRKVNVDEASRVINRDVPDAQVTTEISDYIFRNLGYDIITANELVDLTIDIAASNSVFRPDEEIVLSFYIKQAYDMAKKYCPEIDNLGSDGSYGIRLNIKTLSSGDIKPSDFTAAGLSPDCTILCDGLSDKDDDGDGMIYNLAYGRFKLPDKTGEWNFKVTVDVIIANELADMEFYQTCDEYKSISSNTGKVYQSMGYIKFSVNVTDPTAALATPPDTSAADIMPAGFTVPDANAYIASHDEPVSYRSWKYSKAVKQRTEQNTFIVGFENVTEELEIYPAQYIMEPKDNVPSTYRTADGVVNIRSGYGVGVGMGVSGAGGYGDMNCTPAQKAVILFPEFGYESYAGRFDRWYVSSEDIMNFSIEKNPNSMYYDDPLNDYNSRVHFIPVWYPDGDYDVIFYSYDAWTPVGALGFVQKYTVRISGTLYDDWYITRQ